MKFSLILGLALLGQVGCIANRCMLALNGGGVSPQTSVCWGDSGPDPAPDVSVTTHQVNWPFIFLGLDNLFDPEVCRVRDDPGSR